MLFDEFKSKFNAAIALMVSMGAANLLQPDRVQRVASTFKSERSRQVHNRRVAEKYGIADGRKLGRKAAERKIGVGGGYRGALLTWASEQAGKRRPKQHGRA